MKFNLKRKQNPEVMLCPKCMKNTLRSAFNVSGWLASPMYKCTNCNYSGSLYFVPDDDVGPDRLANKEKHDESI